MFRDKIHLRCLIVMICYLHLHLGDVCHAQVLAVWLKADMLITRDIFMKYCCFCLAIDQNFNILGKLRQKDTGK